MTNHLALYLLFALVFQFLLVTAVRCLPFDNCRRRPNQVSFLAVTAMAIGYFIFLIVSGAT